MTTMRAGRPRLLARFIAAMAAAMLSAATFTGIASAQSFDFDDRFPDTAEFESRIKGANAACLPDPFPLIEHNYGYRLAEGLTTQCASENMNPTQAVKYTLLALASLSTGPVGIAAAGYTLGELSSDGMKCALKALVSASSGMTPEEKKSAMSWIDFGFSLRDWNDFANNIGTVAAKVPELAKPEHVLNLKSAVEAGAAAYERTGEAVSFVQVVSDAAGDVADMAGEMQERAARAVAEYAYGETAVLLDEADQFVGECRFDEAMTKLKGAREAAKEECHEYGVDYRLAEVIFRSYIYQNRIALSRNNALFDGRFPQNPQQAGYGNKEETVKSKRVLLENFSQKFDEIDRLRRTVWEKRGELDLIRSAYERAYGVALHGIDAGGGETVCNAVLESILELGSIPGELSQGCRDELFADNGSRFDRPGDFSKNFNNTERLRSQRWWAEIDRIRAAHAACNTDSADARAAALRAEIENRPIFLIENNLCKEIEQDVILQELDGLSTSEFCSSEDSSPILPDGLFVSRDEVGRERVSKAVAGQELFVQIGFGVRRLSRSDVVSVTLEAFLPDGKRMTFSTPSVSVRPEQDQGYRATAVLLLPEDVPYGTCRITGRIRWGGLGADAGETSFVIEEPQTILGEMVVSSTMGGAPERKYAVGDPITASVELAFGDSDPSEPVSGKWVLTYPDGRKKDLRPSESSSSPGRTAGSSSTLSTAIRTGENTPLGRYQLDLVAGVGERIIAAKSASFEIVPLFEDPEILIADWEESSESLESFRPNDPLFVIGKMIYNSVNPQRQVHISIVLDGPDPGIRALGIEADKGFPKGQQSVGVGRQVPAVIQEGTYTASITLDGGAGQRLTLRDTFKIIYPVQFERIWTRDRSTPPQIKNRFSPGDPFEWFMRYRFVDIRMGDRYSSALWTYVGDLPVSMLSSQPMGPDSPSPGPSTSSFTGIIPLEMPSMTYEVGGVVWYNDAEYYAQPTSFKIGQEPTIAITSPQSGFEVDQKVLVVTGTCADKSLNQAQMFTNGEAIPIKLADGRFSAKTVLRPGRNEIRVVAENGVGISEAGVWGTAYIRAAALKIVLSWETLGPDIDLWVKDPQGVVTNYHKKKRAEGRSLDVDDTSGPGMETYTVEVPLRGRYDVEIHYYAAKGWQGEVPFRVQITTWEATSYENHTGTQGSLYTAAGDNNEPGAVASFSISLQ